MFSDVFVSRHLRDCLSSLVESLRTFALKSFHVQIFSKLLLTLDNDQLMAEKQKNWGVTVLVSEIKRVGNAVFLEVLVMEGEIGFLATRIKISYVEDSIQCLFIHFIANRPI